MKRWLEIKFKKIMEAKSSGRNSNIELLRIIGMLLIVMSHYAHGFEGVNVPGFNKYFEKVFTSFGQVGVGIFLIIAAFFMVDSQVNMKKFLRLYLDVQFYSIVIFMLFLIFKSEYALHPRMILKSFLPILYVNYWYFTSYVIIMLLSPFFNMLIKEMNQHQYKRLLIVLFSVFTISRFLYGSMSDEAISGFVFGKLIPCFNIYFLAGYIKKFKLVLKNRGGWQVYLTRSIIGICLFIAWIVLTLFISSLTGIEKISNLAVYFEFLESPLVVYITYEIFMVALTRDITVKPITNKIASATFGVYLIHEHNLMMNWLFPVLFGSIETSKYKYFAIKAIGSVLFVYVVCTVIDLIRQKLLLSSKEYIIEKINIKWTQGKEHIRKSKNFRYIFENIIG